MKTKKGGGKMVVEERDFLEELLSLVISNHNTVIKEVDGSVDIEIKNAYWNDGYIRTQMKIVGEYSVDIFKNEDGITVNRISTNDVCIVVVDYILYDKAVGYNNAYHLYIVRNNNKLQEV